MDNKEKIYQLALANIKGVGINIWRELIDSFGKGSATTLYEHSSGILNSVSCDSLRHIAYAILNKSTVAQSEQIIQQHEDAGIEVISYYDDIYPSRLRNISTPPCFLYKKGSVNINAKRIISIVGSRKATEYGKITTSQFVRDFCQYNPLIISGLAYGIDYQAHVQALKNNIMTIAVLAGGLDNITPTVHIPLANEIVACGGAIISEYPLGTIPDSYHFPVRNRIIAGCSDAVLVMEAGEKSGSLITALCANDYDREVFAIPGNINATMSIGCNNLIKNNQAHLVNCANDIAMIMNWRANIVPSTTNNISSPSSVKLGPDSQLIVNTIREHLGISLDDLSVILNKELSFLSILLLQLEIDGVIKVLPGNKYTLN